MRRSTLVTGANTCCCARHTEIVVEERRATFSAAAAPIARKDGLHEAFHAAAPATRPHGPAYSCEHGVSTPRRNRWLGLPPNAGTANGLSRGSGERAWRARTPKVANVSGRVKRLSRSQSCTHVHNRSSADHEIYRQRPQPRQCFRHASAAAEEL
jgi:hypothetical protein